MKRRSWTCMLVLLLLAGAAGSVQADDTEIFVGNPAGIEPNVLLIFDNSGSMREMIQTGEYDPFTTYSGPAIPGYVYYKRYTWKNWWYVYRYSVNDIHCQSARNALVSRGFWTGRIKNNTRCGGKSSMILRTGNYLNWIITTGGGYEEKIEVAKRTVRNIIQSTEGVRWGLEVFNESQGGRIVFPVQDIDDTNRQTLVDRINALRPETWTPLGEALYEAGLYYGGERSYYNAGVDYTSPIQEWCQVNYVVIMTDGYSTMDRDVPWSVGSYDGDGDDPGSCASIGAPYNNNNNCSDYLDDVAEYLYETDVSDLTGEQNIITYTIGFDADYELLQKAADQAGGEYYTASSAQELANAFQQAVSEIVSRTSSFVAPVVPINHVNRTYSGDKIYLALFKPRDDGFWPGNIKKYAIATADSTNYERGDLLDANGNPATTANGQIKDTARSFWSPAADGLNIQVGGVHEVMQDRVTARNIYTYLGSDTDLTDASNAFAKGNGDITATLLAVANHAERDKVIDFVHGLDPWDEDEDGETTDKRTHMIGDFLHSRPSVLHYNATTSVIYAGANDGMLHAFRDSDGAELWTFIPPEFFPDLQAIHGDTHTYFVDSSPQIFFTDIDDDGNIEHGDGDRAYLFFGFRRGGTSYYLLDITRPTQPEYIASFDPEDTGLGELGQSWSKPTIGFICTNGGADGSCDGVNDTVKFISFFGAGYDTAQDEIPVTTADSSGRGIYAVDIVTGSLYWSYTRADDADMTYAIPSSVSTVDVDGNQYTDRLYVGDLGGQLWRFDVDDLNKNNWSGKVIFDANPGADASTGRKIFYEPDVVQENGFEYVYFGTGDRAHPNHTGIHDRFYAVKDTNPADPLTEDDLVDVTSDVLQDPTATTVEKDQVRADLESNDGWYIKLGLSTGEKILARPLAFGGAVYFNTFSPSPGDVTGDPCFIGDGSARYYVVHYLDGTAVLNLDETNDSGDDEVLRKSDRDKVIGSGIPSGTIITITGQEAFAYTSVGGGVQKNETTADSIIEPISWRQVY